MFFVLYVIPIHVISLSHISIASSTDVSVYISLVCLPSGTKPTTNRIDTTVPTDYTGIDSTYPSYKHKQQTKINNKLRGATQQEELQKKGLLSSTRDVPSRLTANVATSSDRNNNNNNKKRRSTGVLATIKFYQNVSPVSPHKYKVNDAAVLL